METKNNDNDRSQVDRGISPKKPKPKPAASLATLAAPHGSHRFIVWHVSPRGHHSALCATIRGPPCKQGATLTTLHVFSFDLHTCCVSFNARFQF